MTESLYCINHPNVETYLRCARCGVPICPKCAVRIEVGYVCPACRNRQQQVFYADFRPIHYLIAGIVALPLALIAGLIIPQTGWFVIFLGPLAGMGISEAARWAIRRRRSPYTWLIVAGCIVVGALPWAGLLLLILFSRPGPLVNIYSLGLPILWDGVYIVTAVSTAAVRLRLPVR